MELSLEALTVISQIIPVLLLASFLDGDILKQLSTHSKKAQYYWLSMVGFILCGELFTLMTLNQGGAEGWRGWLIWLAVVMAVVNLFSIALWRIRGISPFSQASFGIKRSRSKN